MINKSKNIEVTARQTLKKRVDAECRTDQMKWRNEP